MIISCSSLPSHKDGMPRVTRLVAFNTRETILCEMGLPTGTAITRNTRATGQAFLGRSTDGNTILMTTAARGMLLDILLILLDRDLRVTRMIAHRTTFARCTHDAIAPFLIADGHYMLLITHLRRHMMKNCLLTGDHMLIVHDGHEMMFIFTVSAREALPILHVHHQTPATSKKNTYRK
tara:strand:+ start:165 stop:701 length:537 start_codon:yes stop_codon:yes gene_type:complete